MKNTTIILIALVFTIGCNTNKTGNNSKNISYTIKGSMFGLPNSKIYLKKYTENGYVISDSTTSVNTKFAFSGKVEYPELIKIQVDALEFDIPVFIENNDITIRLDSAASHAKIEGSASHDLIYGLWSALDSIESRTTETRIYYEHAIKAYELEKAKSLELKLDSLENEPTKTMINFVKQNSNSTVSLFVLYKYLSGIIDFEEIEKLKTAIDTNLNLSTYNILLEKELEILRKTKVGKPAINFSMTDTEGQNIELSSLYTNYLLIDFWASWCPSCREENPSLVRVYNKFKKSGFQILGVSFDKKKENWLKAIKKDKLHWKHVSDLKGWGNEAGIQYGIKAIPSNILIDKNGIIIAKNLSIKELENKLNQLVSK
jgi:peroxiredoxin